MTQKMIKKFKAYLPDNWDILAIIFFMALSIRIYMSLVTVISPSTSDPLGWAKLALENGPGPSAGILYHYFLRLIFLVGGDHGYRLLFILQSLAGSLTVIFIYSIARRTAGFRAGIIAAVLSALFPDFIIHSVTATPATGAIFLLALGMLFTRGEGDDTRRAGWAAALIGLGVYLKPVMVFFIPGLLLTVKRRLRFLLILAALLAPLTALNSILAGRLLPVYQARAFSLDSGRYVIRGMDDVLQAVDEIYVNATSLFSKGQTGADARGAGERDARNAGYIRAYGYLLVMLLGVLGLLKCSRREQLGILLPAGGYYLLAVLFSWLGYWNKILLEPLLIVYASLFAAGYYRSRTDRPGGE
ncbi:MAG: glycosyltransferase family 39 protein [Candidatus Krumholzibacteriota bacterium]|nr:glycosyltransferase family 39 protein [Candidatus Krumholzibacteriota bacterium]